MGPPTQIHKIFVQYLLLHEISKESEGISGYELKKRLNIKIYSGIKEDNILHPPELSQSLVYRILDTFKSKHLIDEKSVIIKNRHQVLHTLNEKGEKHLEYLLKIIHHITPGKEVKLKIIEDFFSGKILPFDLIPKEFPKDRLLEKLKSRRAHLKLILKKMDDKIENLENELIKD